MPPSPQRHSLLTTDPAWVHGVWRVCFAPMAALARLFWTYRAVGQERLPAGAVIVVANHVSFLDTLLVGYALARPCAFMAKASVFTWPVIGRLARWAGALPVLHGEPGATIEQAIAVLDAGYPVVLFPEGGRNPDLKWGSRPLHSGVARLALARPVPIVPIGLSGTEVAWAPDQRWPRRATAEARIGDPLLPVSYLPAGTVPEADALAAITATVREAVAALLPPHLRAEGPSDVSAAAAASDQCPSHRQR